MVLLAFIGAADADILPHFLEHYRHLGVNSFRFALHGEWSGEQLQKLSLQDDCFIEQQLHDPFSEQLKRRCLTQMAADLIGSWILLADTDEFLELPCHSLKRTCQCLELMGAVSLPALTLQRHSSDGTLAALESTASTEERYPMMQFHLAEAMGVSPPIRKTQYPLVKVNSGFDIQGGNHFPPNGKVADVFPIRGVVHHFKWRRALQQSLVLPRDTDANPEEQAVYLAWLKARDWYLPVELALPYSRATLFEQGLLVWPDREQRRMFAAIRKASFFSRRSLPSISPGTASITQQLARGVTPSQEVLLQSSGARPGRICIVSFEVPGPVVNGGIATAVGALAERLAQVGHQVHLLYCPYNGDAVLWPGWAEFWLARGICLHYLPRSVRGSVHYPDHEEFSHTVSDWLEAGEFDLVHCVDADAYGAEMARRRYRGEGFSDTRIVTTVHGPAVWHRAGNGQAPSGDDVQSAEALKDLLLYSDVVCFPSYYMQRWVCENLIDPGGREGQGIGRRESKGAVEATGTFQVVIPNCLAGAGRSFSSSDHGKGPQSSGVRSIDEVVFFGRPEPRKGFGIFCAAMVVLARQGLRFQITILGQTRPESPAEQVLATLTSLGLPVALKENHDGAEAVSYLKTRRALAIVPSLQDNLPYTVLECLEAGIPLITTRCGGIPELFAGDASRALVEPGNVAALASQVAVSLKYGHRQSSLSFDPLIAEMTLVAMHGEWVRPAAVDGPCLSTRSAVINPVVQTDDLLDRTNMRQRILNRARREYRRIRDDLMGGFPVEPEFDDGSRRLLPVLMYHSIERTGSARSSAWRLKPEQFAAQMRWLSENGYHAIDPSELEQFLVTGVLPRENSVVLTFDDGYENFLENAYPVLSQFDLHAWMFVISDEMGRSSVWDSAIGNERPLMSASRVRMLHDSGRVTIGAHGSRHVRLTELSPDVLLDQLCKARSDLESLCSCAPRFIAYPYGACNLAVRKAAFQAGYDFAFGTRNGLVWPGENWFDLPRIEVNPKWSGRQFARILQRISRSG